MEPLDHTHGGPEADVLTNQMAELRQIEKEGYELGVKRARTTFYWISGLVFVSELILAYAKDLLTTAVFIATFVEAGLFLGIGLLTYKRPYIAIIIGLILLVGLRVVGIVYGGSNVFSGIILMVIFVVLLYRALPDAKKWEQMEKEG